MSNVTVHLYDIIYTIIIDSFTTMVECVDTNAAVNAKATTNVQQFVVQLFKWDE